VVQVSTSRPRIGGQRVLDEVVGAEDQETRPQTPLVGKQVVMNAALGGSISRRSGLGVVADPLGRRSATLARRLDFAAEPARRRPDQRKQDLHGHLDRGAVQARADATRRRCRPCQGVADERSPMAGLAPMGMLPTPAACRRRGSSVQTVMGRCSRLFNAAPRARTAPPRTAGSGARGTGIGRHDRSRLGPRSTAIGITRASRSGRQGDSRRTSTVDETVVAMAASRRQDRLHVARAT